MLNRSRQLLSHFLRSSDAYMQAAMKKQYRENSGGAIALQNPVYMLAAVRTPLGAFLGGLSHLTATDLGAIVIKAALERASVSPDLVDSVYMGNVCSANLGQAPARQAALKAGLPFATDCTTINKVCSSGMKAITLAASSISIGVDSIVVAGGMESMSNVPHYAPAVRRGKKMGTTELVDGLIQDGLWDAMYQIHMGECAERTAEKLEITRDHQDAHAIETVRRAKAAVADGTAQWEIVPVQGSKGQGPVTTDEALAKMDPAKLKKLNPVFRTDGKGTITAGNASPITDGAAAVVLASEEAVRKYKLPVLARIVSFSDAAQDPRDFPTAPSLAVLKTLKAAGLAKEEIDLWEINEAFSVVDLANQQILGLETEKVNVFGGSVAIGHPIGASGCRLVVTLMNALRRGNGRFGCAAICNGGGGATAIIIEKVTEESKL